MKAIADTGFIVAFATRNDSHHGWAVDLARRHTEPFLTCEAVLAEAAFQIGSSAYVMSLVNDQLLKVEFSVADNMDRITALAERYQERSPDLADLCIIRMSELFPSYTVLTVDEEDFRIYRRNRREVIPILCPGQARG